MNPNRSAELEAPPLSLSLETRIAERVDQELKECLDHCAEGLHWGGPDGTILWANQTELDLLGYSRDEYIGHNIAAFHVDPPVIEDMLARLSRGETLLNYEARLRHKNGSVRHVLVNSNVLWRGEEFVHTRCFTRDITERCEREQAVRKEAELQKRLLYSLFMQAPTLIAVLRGPSHVIELANPPICQIWGHTEEELINRPIFRVLPELQGQGFRSLLDGVYRTGLPHVGKETPATFDRGRGRTETVYFNFVYSPFRNIEGAVEGIFVIASDVTEQILARNQVNELRETAEAANRAKDDFLAMLGHELRNPLSPILTALQLMKLRGGDSSERERTVIERQVNHLTRLVDDLLDVSRIARGKVELMEEIVEMGEVVAKAIEMASPLLEQHTHTLTVQVPRRGLAVEGDPTRLSQVISNLLTNAAKYTPPGGHIMIRATEEHGNVVVRVRDTGIGIAPEVLSRIFDPFVQERQAIDRAQGGLGLGLTIVRNLIERHRGSVSAHSDGPGRGSEFVIRLPIVELPRAIGHEATADPGSVEPAHAAAGALRILVVDDNEDSAEMLADALKAKGHLTGIAHDAPAALRIAETFTPDIAFLDIGLPVMDGYELGARLRALPGLAGIRLIALTGYGQESDRQKTRAAGFDHHLVKPVDFNAVEAAVSGGSGPP
jgi:PAS domain S-box-containing protein